MDSIDRYASIADPLLRQSEALNLSISQALQYLRDVSKNLEQSQVELASRDDKIVQLERELEEVKGNLEKTRVQNALNFEILEDDAPAPPHPGFELQTKTIDGHEYIAKADYESLQVLFQNTSRKYNNVRQKAKHVQGRLELEQARTKKQAAKYGLLAKEYELEKRKIETYEKEFQKVKQFGEVTKVSIDRIKTRNSKAMKQYDKWNRKFDQWKEEVLEAGAIQSSDFDRLPQREKWPDFETSLARLEEKLGTRYRGAGSEPGPPTSSNVTAPATEPSPGKASISEQPPIATATDVKEEPKIESPLIRKLNQTQLPPETPTRPYTYADPDATSDEEPESALLKFSPTSRAILQRPGAETLAVLHPGAFSPTQVPLEKEGDEDIPRPGTKESPVCIKSESNSEGDWYGKYGYSRLITGEENSIDLDNVPEVRRAGRTSVDGFKVPSTEPTTTPGPNRLREMSISQEEGREYVQRELEKLSEERVLTEINVSRISEAGSKATTPAVSLRPMRRFLNLDHDMAASSQSSSSDHRDPLKEIPQPNSKLPTEPQLDGQVKSPKGGYITGSKVRPATVPGTPLETTPYRNAAPLSTSASLPRRQPLSRNNRNKMARSMKSAIASTLEDGTFEGTDLKADSNSTEKRKKARTGTAPPAAGVASKEQGNPFSPSKYRINTSKNDGLNFAFTEVVRDKARKDCLPTCVKPCCRDLASGKLQEMWQPPKRFTGPRFRASDSSQPDGAEEEEEENLARRDDHYRDWREKIRISEQALQYGRHRAQHERAPEPLHFWESDFPTTQQLQEQREESDKRYKEKGWRMHEESKRGGMYQRRA
ncbi:hypothetical protein ABW19_dt0208481 [Dactylella cylindrospora]|nr:hypothetical protein ABW19_dt0208481 [Dactylella cylindrospora]